MTRKETTAELTLAAIRYLVKNGYAVYQEISIAKGGTLRGDVVGINSKRQIVVIEVKSCQSDYRTDIKWTKYLAFCHKFYFLFPPHLEVNGSFPSPGKGSGVLTVEDGMIKVKAKATLREVDSEDIDTVLMRMAYRSSLSSFKERKSIQRADKRRKNNC